MKKILILTLIIIGASTKAQILQQEGKNYIPEITPPSPTVNALMKFEEVPVSNYTGIPDISIPITNIETGLRNAPMNVSLKYHIYNAKPEEKASEVGAGWSLFAGGTIARTVLGGPDDKLVTYTPGGKRKIGIYFDENTNVDIQKNHFHHIIDGVNYIAGNYNLNEQVYEAYYLNRYDTQYDLYQYNFSNYTGRFIIKKNNFNELYIEKLDKNNLKIEVNYTSNFEPISFTITDESGNIYLFDVLESSTTGTFSDSQGAYGDNYTNFSTYTGATPYNSAFLLSTIKNSHRDSKVLLKYTLPQSIVSNDISHFQRNYNMSSYSENSLEISQNKSVLPRINELIVSNIITNTRKLSEIEIINKAKINFEYELGREDTNYTGAQNASKLSKLKSIKIRANDASKNEKYELNYSYKTTHNIKRLFLNSIDKKYETNTNDVLDGNYELEYYESPFLGELTLDNWRFSKCIGDVSGGFTYANECVSVGLLKSLKNPTKGKAEFIYEPNTYSYIPETTTSQSSHAEELTNFDDNELNWDVVNSMVVFNTFSYNIKKYAFTINGIQAMQVSIFRETSQIDQYPWQIRILKKNGNNYDEVGGFGTAFLASGETLPNIYYLNATPGEYYFELTKASGSNAPNFNASFNIFYKTKNMHNYKYLFGGGVRIQSIEYFANQNNISDKKMNYSYHNLSDYKKSTGALVFPKPVFSYTSNYKAMLQYNFGSLNSLVTADFSTNIKYSSNKNFLPVQKTKGGDIGYQFVSVYEMNKGKTIYQYTSPIDYPNLYTQASLPPFNSVPNYDFERGNLKNKKIYNNTGNLLSENKFFYSSSSTNNKTGAKFNFVSDSHVGEFLYGGTFNFYSEFAASNSGVALYLGTETNQILSMYVQQELSGNTYLIKEEQIEYFTNQNPITTITDYLYNSRDYPIEKKTTFPSGEINLTGYNYAHEKFNSKLIDANMIGIPLETTVIKKKDINDAGKLISKIETIYPDQTNFPTMQAGNYLVPLSIKSTDLQNSETIEITYDKYDTFGNLQQYTTKAGISTAIIWGYNNTQPIAKIEGAEYENIKSLAASIVTASNADALAAINNDESTFLTALDDFRIAVENAPRQNAQITTYTYDPLLGLRSITPPSGIRQKYIYDTANRLEKILQEDGKILQEFKYNYKQ